MATPFTLPQVEKMILKYHRLLTSSPRSDPHRSFHLQQLAAVRTHCYALSDQKSDLDRSITHLTEAVLLPFQPSQDVVHVFFRLASILLNRFVTYRQPEDVKSLVKYFRFLRINFHPLEAFDIPRLELTSYLVRALAENLMLGSGDMIPDSEEMAALSLELLSSDVSTSDLIVPIKSFSVAIHNTFHPYQEKLPPERVIRVLRKATTIIPDGHDIPLVLARCLTHRFQKTHATNEYEEAIALADKMVADHYPGDILTPTLECATGLIFHLVVIRLNTHMNPEVLEDSIHRLRALLRVPSFSDRGRANTSTILEYCLQMRSTYFGVTRNSLGSPSRRSPLSRVFYVTPNLLQRDAGPNHDGSQWEENMKVINEIHNMIQNDEIPDVEWAVECARTLLPPPQSFHPFFYIPAATFAHILSQAYKHTKRQDYLNEAITTYRDIRKMSTSKVIHYQAREGLLHDVLQRHILFDRREDLEEAMQLFSEVANDGSAEVFHRFKQSDLWAGIARIHGHPSISTAYETAMSLMQETLVFSPTLQFQHFRLVDAFRGRGLPSDYASYQIETGQLEQATETLERGRALLWSEMRGLRISTDQLRVADPALADKLADINRRLESVTMSVAQSESEEIGDSGTGTRRHEGMDSVGHLVTTQQILLKERDTLISHIQSLPGFKNFLKPPLFDVLNSAASQGPVIIINQSQSPFPSYILLLLKDSPPSVISTPSNFHHRANRLKDQLLRVRKEKGLDSKDYDLTLASVLADLYELVGKPVIERLRQLEVPEKSRVWWCPAFAFCSLPLHAMGPIPSDDSDKVYFMDLYTPSYTPTLSALIEARKPGPQPKTLDKPPLLLVAQPETMYGAWDEIRVIQKTTKTPVTTLVSAMATPKTVVERLRDHQFVHFVCHGLLETGKPFDASFELHGDNLTLLEIVRSQLPAAEFAFLSACHTAELTEDSVSDEGLHLAAAMQFCGFRSVVGTMWAMADTDGADLSKRFYKSIFAESPGRRGMPSYERSATALQFAVEKLRKKRGITLERWVNFVHYGA